MTAHSAIVVVLLFLLAIALAVIIFLLERLDTAKKRIRETDVKLDKQVGITGLWRESCEQRDQHLYVAVEQRDKLKAEVATLKKQVFDLSRR